MSEYVQELLHSGGVDDLALVWLMELFGLGFNDGDHFKNFQKPHQQD
jgi:hypothetical protein